MKTTGDESDNASLEVGFLLALFLLPKTIKKMLLASAIQVTVYIHNVIYSHNNYIVLNIRNALQKTLN